jgi:hypothetical protein
MRALVRSFLALVTLAATMMGCNKSRPSDPAEDGANQGSARTSSDVTMLVPGMT